MFVWFWSNLRFTKLDTHHTGKKALVWFQSNLRFLKSDIRYSRKKATICNPIYDTLPWNKHLLNCVADPIRQQKEEGHPRCHSACCSTTWAQGSFYYHRLNIEHVNLSPTSNFSPFSFTQWLKLFLRFSILNHNFCSGLTVADGGWPNNLRGSSVGKQTNMQAEQLHGSVHYHRLHIGGVHWRTFLLHILLFSAGIVPWTRSKSAAAED